LSVSVLELIKSLEAGGVRFRLDGDRVKATVPDPAPLHFSETLGTLRVHRSEVVTLLRERTRRAPCAGKASPVSQGEAPTRSRLSGPQESPKPSMRERAPADPKRPLSREDLRLLLPGGVRLIRYSPKKPPVAVAPISIVTDMDKFIRAYVRDLGQRLQYPGTHACASLPEILAKLAEVGLELALDGRQTDSAGAKGEPEGQT
jgi:hypothetical protein